MLAWLTLTRGKRLTGWGVFLVCIGFAAFSVTGAEDTFAEKRAFQIFEMMFLPSLSVLALAYFGDAWAKLWHHSSKTTLTPPPLLLLTQLESGLQLAHSGKAT